MERLALTLHSVPATRKAPEHSPSVIRRLRQSFTIGGPRFRRVLAMTFFNGGSMVGEMLLFGLAVYEISESTAWVGLALALYFAPNFVVGVFAGTLSDSFDRVWVLRAAEAALGINLTLIGLLTAGGAAGLALILALTLVSGVFRAIHNPARASYAFDLAGAERIVSALGALNIAQRFGQLGGAFAAGWAAAEFGIGAAYVGLASAHVLALVALGRQRGRPAAPAAERPSVGAGLIEFARELAANRTLLVLVLVTAAVEVLGFSFLTALPDIVVGRLGLDAASLGVLHASRAAGGILMAALGPSRRLGMTWLAVVAGFGLMVMALGLAPSLSVAALVSVAIALGAVASDVLTMSMMQLAVPGEMRGRAMGAWQFSVGFSVVGHLEIGLLASALGTATALLLNGAALVLVALGAGAVSRRLRRM